MDVFDVVPHYFTICPTLISPLFLFILMGVSYASSALGATFTVINKCDYTIWPAILSNAGSSTLDDTTGFELQPGRSWALGAPPNWSGRFWARTGCIFDPITGQGNCVTGDCGSNQVQCNGAGATPPATLAEFTIGSGVQQDFYDVSLVDGFNLPVLVDAAGGSGSCGSTGCVADLNLKCPNELRVGDRMACKSACEAFRSPEYCCSGAYDSPATCKPSIYSEIFKSACPKSYSYAYDDATSTFTCSGADYTITFCPTTSSQKSARDSSAANVSGTGEVPMVIEGPWFTNFFTSDSFNINSSSSWNAILAILIFLFLQSFRL